MNRMIRIISQDDTIPSILLFTIIALALLLIITYFNSKAKKEVRTSLLYLLGSALFIGITGIRASALNNPFYFYMVVLFWNFLAGVVHLFLSKRILEWYKTESIVWKMLFSADIAIAGFAGLLTFMKIVDYETFVLYNLSAVLTFFIPQLFMYAFVTYMEIPKKIFLPQQMWIYNRSNELVFKGNEISHFLLVKYRLNPKPGEESIVSLPMRAPANIRIGDYFNSTLECYKVTQGRYSIEVKDASNNNLKWYLFLQEGNKPAKMIDPNKTFMECGMSNAVYFGNSGYEEIETITDQAEREGKFYLIICTRESEYKSQLMQS
jgi:hypothetical protein